MNFVLFQCAVGQGGRLTLYSGQLADFVFFVLVIVLLFVLGAMTNTAGAAMCITIITIVLSFVSWRCRGRDLRQRCCGCTALFMHCSTCTPHVTPYDMYGTRGYSTGAKIQMQRMTATFPPEFS